MHVNLYSCSFWNPHGRLGIRVRDRTVEGATMPKRDSAQGQATNRTVEMPQPTKDQREYLDAIFRSAGKYDPELTIGGRRDRRPPVA